MTRMPAPTDAPPEILIPATDTLTIKDVEGKLTQSLDPSSSYDLMLYRFGLIDQVNTALSGGEGSSSTASAGSGPLGPRRR